MSIARALFVVLGVATVVFAVRMVTTQSLVRSLLLHVITLFLLGLAYLTAGAYLIGAVQIMVFAGSITVMFVFALMLTPVGYGTREALDRQSRLRALLAAAGILGLTLYALMSTPAARSVIDPPELAPVAESIFTAYAYPFELLSLVLLVAMAGVAAIVGQKAQTDHGDDRSETSDPS